MGPAIPAITISPPATRSPTAASSATPFTFTTSSGRPTRVSFYVNGVLYETRTPADVPSGDTWVYDHPFYVILNVAVGGSFPGNPDSTTQFPQTMKVDYVRVYSKG